MSFLKEKIKNHIKEKLTVKALHRIDAIKAEMKKKFTIFGLFILGILLIIQGFIRLLPNFFGVPDYFGFFMIGSIVLIIAFIYYLRNKKKHSYYP